jgi:hypothetical protein
MIQLRLIYQGKRAAAESRSVGFREVTFEDFEKWFTSSNYDSGCHYCGLTSDESLKLASLRSKATRGGRRGNRLELDRIDPDMPYDELANLVWCCYWCNNAKTNFFTHDEFLPIGKAIGDALRKIK